MATFDYDGAKAAGYSDEEITGYLQSKSAPPAPTSNGEKQAVEQPNQSSSQAGDSNPLGGLMGFLGNAGKWAYDNLNPYPTITKTALPIVEGMGRTAAIVPPLLGAIARGKNATSEQKNQFSQDWQSYNARMNAIRENLNNRLFNPQTAGNNYLGIGGEVGSTVLAGGLSGPLSSAIAGSPIKKWLLSRALTGAATGGLYGSTRPEDQTVESHLGRGLGSAALGTFTYPVMSALVEGATKIPQILQNESKYLIGKKFNTIAGESLNEPAFQDKVNDVVMNKTSGMKPETVAKQLREATSNLTEEVQKRLDAAPAPVSSDDVEQLLTDSVKDKIQGYSKSDQTMRDEFIRLLGKARQFIETKPKSATDVNPETPLYQTTLGDLFKGKQTIGKYLDDNGAWERLNAGNGTPMDQMGRNMYNALKGYIDDQLVAQGQPEVSQLTALQNVMMEAGKAGLKGVKSEGNKSVNLYSMLRGLPFFNMMVPYLQAGEIGALRGANDLGGMLNPVSNPMVQSAAKILPGLLLMNKLKPTSSDESQAPGGMIKVYKNDTGATGYIAPEDYDPSVYTKIP